MNFGHFDVIIHPRLKKSKYAIFGVFPAFPVSDFWEEEESLHFAINGEFIKEKRKKSIFGLFEPRLLTMIKIYITYLIRNCAVNPKTVLICSQIFFWGVMTS